MNKLLSDHLSRLWRNKLFWLCMGGMLFYAVAYMMYAGQHASLPLTGKATTLENYYFQFLLHIGFFYAAFTSMFLGTEYSDGTLRNKLIIGHSRINVYLANLTGSFVAGMLMMCAWFIGALAGVPTLGSFTLSPAVLAEYALICVLLAAVYASINTFIAMLSSNKTVTVLVSFVLAFGSLLCASLLYNLLEEPETIYSMSGITINGDASLIGEEIPNPNYIGGAMRFVFQMLLDILPTGQSVHLAFLEVQRPMVMMLASVALIAGVTVCGIRLFCKKDLK